MSKDCKKSLKIFRILSLFSLSERLQVACEHNRSADSVIHAAVSEASAYIVHAQDYVPLNLNAPSARQRIT